MDGCFILFLIFYFRVLLTILSEKLVESEANTEGIRRVFHWPDPQWKNNYQSTKETNHI